jgi:hypothetical protein
MGTRGVATWLGTFLWAGLLLANAGHATSKTLVLAAGDCGDPELVGSMLVLSEATKARLADDQMDAAGVLTQLRPRQTLSLEDIQRLVDAAQTQFYSVQYDKALRNIKQALAELDAVPVTAKPWRLAPAAHVLHSLIEARMRHPVEATEAFRRVLRVSPRFVLDPDYYMPSTRLQFDKVRSAVAAEKSAALSVFATPGAEVFLDGAPVGKTPLTARFPRGTYRLALAKQDALSFVRTVKLEDDVSVHMDFEFEASVQARLPLCIMDRSAGQNLDKPLELAAFVGADEVVVLWVDSRASDSGFATAKLVQVNRGKLVRVGGTTANSANKSEALVQLADFVLTGQVGKAVVAMAADGLAPAPAPAKPEALASTPPVAPAGPRRAEPEALQENSRASAAPRSTWMRPASYVAFGTGALAGVGAGVVWFTGAADRQKLAGLLDAQKRLPADGTPEGIEARRLSASHEARVQTVTGLLVATGALVVGGAALLYFAPAGDGSATVSATVGPSGVFVSGSF